jgi:hypothetical protein
LATGHTPPGASLAKRGAPLTAPPGRRPFAYWPHTPPPPPLAREADGPHREKGSHALPGLPLATYWPPTGPPGRPLTGHLRALYWPSGEASHWPKGSHTPHWPQWEGRGRLRPALPPTGHLRPPPADRGLRTGGLPTPRLTHWPKGGVLATYAHPLATPAPPPPRTFGSGGLRDGEGFLRAKGGWPPAPVRTGTP